MDSQTSSAPSSTRAARRRSRDTGFPEPFAHCSNTTLPHPEADLSPNACISHDDLAGDHALKRKRLSFLHRHSHRRNISHGFLSAKSELVMSSVLTLTLTDTRADDPPKEYEPSKKLASVSTTSFQSRDGTESARSNKGSGGDDGDGDGDGDGDTPPTSPDGHSPKRSGLFSKWRRA